MTESEHSPLTPISRDTFLLLMLEMPYDEVQQATLAKARLAEESGLHVEYFFDGVHLMVEVSEKSSMQFKPKRRRK